TRIARALRARSRSRRCRRLRATFASLRLMVRAMSKFVPLCFLLLLLFAASPASGQSNYATLGGTVFDPQRQVVPGASVQVTSSSTQAARQVSTNDQGAFQLT